MAFATVQTWDETQTNNTTIDTTNINEGCDPSGVNDALRKIMAQVAAWTGDDTIASAGTTDLSTVNGQFVTISGTTTITGLGTIKAGWLKFVRFSGTLTLTHNATSLILPGTANITVAARDSAVFVSLGSGNWQCLAFQPAAGYPLLNAVHTWTAAQTIETSSSSPLTVSRTGSAINAAAAFTTTAGTVYAGNADGTSFAIDGDNNIDSTPWFRASASALTTTVPVRVPDGTVSAPSVAFSGDTNTGFYSSAADFLAVAVGGDHLAYFNSFGLTVTATDPDSSATFGSVASAKVNKAGSVDLTMDAAAAIRASRTTDNGIVANWFRNATSVGNVSVTTSTTTYNTSSDERLKEFIGPYDPMKAIEIIRADPVRDWNWIADRGGGYGVGWGAQTSYSVSADLATPGNEDSDEWGVDKGARTPYLWAALTWALDKIDELETRLDAAGL